MPYRLFEPLDENLDYDQFLAYFLQLYEMDPSEEEAYLAKLREVQNTGVTHPYLALAESRYFTEKKEYGKALEALRDLENSYQKFFEAGNIFMELGLYPEAEEQFEAAEKFHPAGYDRNLIYGLFFSKYYGGKQQEAREFAQRVEDLGYEPFIMPLKLKILEDACKKILKDRKPDQLSEEEDRTICEYAMLTGQYEQAIQLCRRNRT